MKSAAAFSCNGQAKYSPCGQLLAIPWKNALTVISAERLSPILELYHSSHIDECSWSPDSKFILCISRKTDCIGVFSMLQQNWSCQIKTGKEGLQHAVWSPNSREIVTTSKYNVRLRVWSLTGEKISFPADVKFFSNSLLSFSGCGGWFAASCIEEKSIIIFNTSSWKKEKIIQKLDEFSKLVWSPVDDTFALQPESNFKSCHIQVFSSATGNLVGEFKREPGKSLKGAKILRYSRCGQLLAVGCYDGAVYILDHILWRPLAKFEHTTQLDKKSNCLVLQICGNAYEEVVNRPISFKRLDHKNGEFCPGPKLLEFNENSTKLASIEESMPAVVWIWDICNLALKLVIVCKGSVKSLAWANDSTLAISDSETGVTIIAKEMKNAVVLEADTIGNLSWRPSSTNQSQLLMVNNSQVCVFSKT